MKTIDSLVLIDDNEITNFYHNDLMEELGIAKSILIIPSAKEAMQYFHDVADGKQPRPDLILLDIKMQDFDGFDLLTDLEEYNSDCPELLNIAILTSSILKRDREMAERFPYLIDFIEKPLIEEKLIHVITKVIPR